jgi:hypothetical protein
MKLIDVFVIKEAIEKLTSAEFNTLDVIPFSFGEDDQARGYGAEGDYMDQAVKNKGLLPIPGQVFDMWYNPKHWNDPNKPPAKRPGELGLDVTHYEPFVLVPKSRLATKLCRAMQNMAESDWEEEKFGYPGYQRLWMELNYGELRAAGFEPEVLTDVAKMYSYLGLDYETWLERKKQTDRQSGYDPDDVPYSDKDPYRDDEDEPA